MSSWFTGMDSYQKERVGVSSIVTALNAFSTFSQIKDISLNTKINRNIEGFNYNLERMNAAKAIESSHKRAEDIREQTRRDIGNTVAAFGASNLVTTSGSALLVQLEQRRLGETAAQDAIQEGLDVANASNMRAEMASYRSNMLQKQAKNAKKQTIVSGIAKLGTSLIGMQ